MAITATDRGTGSHNSSTTTFNAFNPSGGSGGLTGTIAAGSTGILFLSMDNANGATTNVVAVNSSYTDSKGNVWYVKAEATSGIAGANAEGVILTSLLTSSVTSSDTLTITLTAAATAKVWGFIEAAPSAGNIVIPCNSSVGTISTTNVPTVSPSDGGSTGELYIGAGFAEMDSGTTWTTDTDTTSGPIWSTPQTVVVGSGTTNGVSLITQWKILTSYNLAPFNPTLSASVDVRMGWIFLAEADAKIRSLAGSPTSQTTVTVTVAVPMGAVANSLGVLCIGADNSVSGGATPGFPTPTVADTKSNTWTLRHDWIFDNGAANQGAEIGVYTAPITTPLVVGDSISVTAFGTNVPSKSWALWEFAPTGAGTVTYVTGASTGTGSTTTSPSITSGSITNGDYVIGVMAAEGNTGTDDNVTADAGTTNGTWMKQASHATGTAGTTSMAVATQWKKVTATATQTYNPTQGSNDTIIGWLQLNDSSPTGGLTAAQKAAFFQMF